MYNIFTKSIIYILIIVFIVLEEVIWKNILKYIYEPFSIYNPVLKLTRKIHNIKSRYLILLIFIFPFVLEEVFGLLSLYMLGLGYIKFGILIYILKILFMLPAAVIFKISKEKLLTFFFINKIYQLIIFLKSLKIYLDIKNEIKKYKIIIKNTIKEQLNGKGEIKRVYNILKKRFLKRK